MRDDSSLYTGLTSNASKVARARRQKAKDTKEAQRGKLMTAYDIVNAEITRTQEEIQDESRTLIRSDMTDREVKTVRLGLMLAEDRMIALRVRLNNLMREPKKAKDEDL